MGLIQKLLRKFDSQCYSEMVVVTHFSLQMHNNIFALIFKALWRSSSSISEDGKKEKGTRGWFYKIYETLLSNQWMSNSLIGLQQKTIGCLKQTTTKRCFTCLTWPCLTFAIIMIWQYLIFSLLVKSVVNMRTEAQKQHQKFSWHLKSYGREH